MGIELNLIAINHWPVAIDSHAANHAYAQHLCSEIDDLNPRKLVPSGRLQVLVASPECTHHSNARGGKPMSDQSRAAAWHVLRWAEALYIENILIENVKEFRSWGPLGANGRPIKRLRGELYLAFLASLRALGYKVEDKILNAADYGDPTTRERLFVIARRGNRPIIWPARTHASTVAMKRQAGDLFGQPLKPWRTAREIIDWNIPGKSIFERKRPLAPKTLARIAAGIRKFCGEYAEPFLVMLYGTGKVQSVDEPLPTVTATGTHVGLCEPFLLGQQSGAVARSLKEPVPTVAAKGAVALVEPFIIGAGGPARAGKPRGVDAPLNTILAKNSSALIEPFMTVMYGKSTNRSIDEPLPTVTAGAGHVALVEPFIIPQFSDHPAKSVDEPLGTVTTTSRGVGLVEPFMLSIDHQTHGDSVRSVDQPVPTVTTKARTCLVEPFMVPYFGEREGQEPRCHSVDEPVPAVTSHGAGALVEPFLLVLNHGDKAGEKNPAGRRSSSIDEPIPTITTNRSHGLVEPFIVKYNGTAKAQSIDEPLDTVSTRDRFGLVETEAGTFRLDIRFRMLEPHELAAAQGLAGYKFTGKKTEVVKQIGNAVPKGLATALCSELLI
jgi:DNA (cytosine-5)-methyltransferase 1